MEGLFEETLVLPEACLLRVIGILWRDERWDERLRMSCARDASGERKPRRLHWNAQALGSKRGTRRRATGKKREEQSLEIVLSRSQERSSAPRLEPEERGGQRDVHDSSIQAKKEKSPSKRREAHAPCWT